MKKTKEEIRKSKINRLRRQLEALRIDKNCIEEKLIDLEERLKRE
jgi:hypothetical protein